MPTNPLEEFASAKASARQAGLLAACVVMGLGLLVALGAMAWIENQLTVARGENERLKGTAVPSRVLSATDLNTLSMVGPAGSTAHGRFFWSASERSWFLTDTGLPQPAPEQVYQLWAITPQGKLLLGIFTHAPDTASGNGRVPEPLQELMITSQAAPGAPQPEGPAVLSGKP
jgi:hypothetical protein